MGKKNKSYHSNHVLGKLHDQILIYIEELKNSNEEYKTDYFDSDLLVEGYEDYIFEALVYFKEYYTDLVFTMKKNEISNESELLTGNNVDDTSTFGKKKHNYDAIERLGIIMKETINKSKNYFNNSSNFLFNKNDDKINFILNNNKHKRASAYYYVAYDIVNIKQKYKNKENLNQCFNDFYNCFEYNNKYDYNDNNYSSYMIDNFGLDSEEECYIEDNYINTNQDELNEIISGLIEKTQILQNFFSKKISDYKIPTLPNEENVYRILSFPWSCVGDILSDIKHFKNLR